MSKLVFEDGYVYCHREGGIRKGDIEEKETA